MFSLSVDTETVSLSYSGNYKKNLSQLENARQCVHASTRQNQLYWKSHRKWLLPEVNPSINLFV